MSAPRGFRAMLAPLPEGARVVEHACAACAMMIVFFGSRAELAKEIDRLATRRDFRCLWIVWRKKSTATPSDLRQQDVRALGLAAR